MDIIGRYKLLFEILIIGSIVAGVVWGVHSFLMHEQQIGYDRRVAEDNKALLIAQEAARKTEADLRKQLEVAQNAATQREQALRATAAAASAASSSLRDTLTTIRNGVPTATLDALRVATVALADVLGNCQDRYRDVAEKADRHASDVRTLTEAWPK